MRRITVYESDGSWHVSSADREGQADYRTILEAAVAAKAYGETLRGEAPGYLVRLQASSDIDQDQSIALHTERF